jgi:hypothetical protein
MEQLPTPRNRSFADPIAVSSSSHLTSLLTTDILHHATESEAEAVKDLVSESECGNVTLLMAVSSTKEQMWGSSPGYVRVLCQVRLSL